MTARNRTVTQHPSAPPQFFFLGQAVHFLLLILLIGSAWALVDFNHLADRHLLSISGQVWFIIALSVPILHQVFVWLAWHGVANYALERRQNGSGSKPF
jgi:hypothetical protein